MRAEDLIAPDTTAKLPSAPKLKIVIDSEHSRSRVQSRRQAGGEFKIAVTTPQDETMRWTTTPPNPREYERAEIRMCYEYKGRSQKWFCVMLFVLLMLAALLVGTILSFSLLRKDRDVIIMVAVASAIVMWIIAIFYVRYILSNLFDFLLTSIENYVQQPKRDSVSSNSSRE